MASVWAAIKEAMIATFGMYVTFFLIALLGMSLAAPGFYLVMKEREKKKDARNDTRIVFGGILLVVGCLIMLPLILDVLIYVGLQQLFDAFE